jgi:2-keto-3-deoxy-6-phosphogluconate aldolase
MPDVFTTEILAAESNFADIVECFPRRRLTPLLRTCTVLPQLKLMPTGGVINKRGDWIKASAIVVATAEVAVQRRGNDGRGEWNENSTLPHSIASSPHAERFVNTP